MNRLVRIAFAVTLALLVAGIAAVPLPAAPTEPAKEVGKPIDVVICLDVSGSMNGLISSAKTKLWDIINDLAKIKPTPQLRVALYSYGHSTYDAKAGWVRK
jgi:biopolymer transport protein ExbD